MKTPVAVHASGWCCVYVLAVCVGIAVFLAPRRGNATEQLAPRMPIPARPATRIVPAVAPPVVDGELDDPCWQDAVAVRPFTLSYQSAFAPYHAEALLTYTPDHLYAALRVVDPDPAESPALPWPPDQDPAVAELLIAVGRPETFYKVAVTSTGEVRVTQPMGNTMPWRIPPQAVLKRQDRIWTAEFAAPFAGVALPNPAANRNGHWRINLGWRTTPRLNFSAWAVTHAWFYEPQFYADLYFADNAAVTAELAQVQPAQFGENPLPVRIVNRGESDAACEVMVSVEDETGTQVSYCSLVDLPPKTTQEVPANYVLTDGMRGVATVAVREPDSPTPFFQQSVVVDLPANGRAIREIRAALAALDDPPARNVPMVERERSLMVEELRGLVRRLHHPRTTRAAWYALARPIERLSGRARKLAWYADNHSRLANASFAVGALSSLEKVKCDALPGVVPAEVVSMSAARGEVEAAQLLIIPLYRDVAEIEVEQTALLGPSGSAIPKENVRVYWTDFVQSRPPRYPIECIGWWADPLIPMDAAPRAVSKDALHQPLWISVHTPTGTPAGVYTGALTLHARDAKPWTVQLRVRVYDFDLPERPALKTSMWLNPERITTWYGWDAIPKDVARKQMAFLLEHKLNPCWFAPVGNEQDVEWQIQHGLNCAMLGVASEWPLAPDMEAQIQKWYDFFKERDLLDLAFIYGQDEPSPHDYPKVRDTLQQVAERWPGVRRVCTAYPRVPTLEGAVDTWVVGPNLFNYGPVADRVAAGDELWFYLSASVRRPYAMQLYLDYTAMEHRLIGWYCWKYGATGFLYWGINEWDSNIRPWSGLPEIDEAIRGGKRWPEVPWNAWTYLDCNGDAQYIYPGPDGEFWSSVRMEILRDSFEDYEYLALLDSARKRLVEARLPATEWLAHEAEKLLALEPPIVSDLTEATRDPNVLMNRRRAIAECIEQIQHYLEGE